MKVLPKTMSDGYDSWWHVGVSENSENPSIEEAYQRSQAMLKNAKTY